MGKFVLKTKSSKSQSWDKAVTSGGGQSTAGFSFLDLLGIAESPACSPYLELGQDVWLLLDSIPVTEILWRMGLYSSGINNHFIQNEITL